MINWVSTSKISGCWLLMWLS